MNKDLDERLVPNGEYRDALNVEVSTADSSDIGVVKNILGNHRLDTTITSGFTCVGSIEDEKTNKLYWFISSSSTDAIVEYSIDESTETYVFVDKYANTSKAVLKLTGKIITAINIIDNLLLWTDNINDPRKINIDECKKGTSDINTHTQLSFDKGSFNGMTIDLITDNNNTPFTPLSKGERVWYNKNQLEALLSTQAVLGGFIFGNHEVKHYRGSKYLGIKNIQVFSHNEADGNLDGTYLHAVDDFVNLNINQIAWEVGDVIFGNDTSIDIEERHITVIKLKPFNALSVKTHHEQDVSSISSIPNLFETKLPRFSYRYKYTDGEFSAFAPFTHPVFNPKYPRDTSVSNDTNIFYSKDTAYGIKEPHNKAMTNSIHSIELTDFITVHTPEDVIEVEILYKQEESPTIYSIGTVKRSHKNWHK